MTEKEKKQKIKVTEIKKDIKVKEIPRSELESQVQSEEIVQIDSDNIKSNSIVFSNSSRSSPSNSNTRQVSQSPQEIPQPLQETRQTPQEAEPFTYTPRRNSSDFTYSPRNAPITAPEVIRQFRETQINPISPRNDLMDRSANIRFSSQTSADDVFRPSQDFSLMPEKQENYHLDKERGIAPVKRRTELF